MNINARADVKDHEKEAKKLKRELKELSNTVLFCIREMDAIGKGLSVGLTKDSGRKLAHLANKLEMANDSARFFALGIDYRNNKNEPVK